MPTIGSDYRNLSPALRAYERAYLAKGCSPRKARELAYRKATRPRGRTT